MEYTDKLFCKLLELFKGLEGSTEVIVTSEHGDLFGPEFYGHSPGFEGVRFDEKLFEIPFIRGWVNRVEE